MAFIYYLYCNADCIVILVTMVEAGMIRLYLLASIKLVKVQTPVSITLCGLMNVHANQQVEVVN